MPLLAEDQDAKSTPPNIQLPFGLSFHDSFSTGGDYLSQLILTPGARDETSSTRLVEGSRLLDDPSHRIPRKPVPSRVIESSPQQSDPRTPLSATTPNTALLGQPQIKSTSNIYWIIPATALTLFLLGFIAAIGHHVYLDSLDEVAVENQVWINRYSLALAFIVKATLSASASLSFSQSLWHSLQSVKRGISISAIDALFAIDESPQAFMSWEIYRRTFDLTFMALTIWLMPLITLVSPTALTVGTSIRSSTNPNCAVPMLNIFDLPNKRSSLSLFDVDYTGNEFAPSISSRSIVDLTAENGRQLGWYSPCGSNCTYNITFHAPSLECERTGRIDDPSAPWTAVQGPSYWFDGYGNGSNVTMENANLEYSPVYSAAYNNYTSQFWVGVTDSVELRYQEGMTVKEFLDLHVYHCEFMETKYNLRVTYIEHQQSNDLLDYTYVSQVKIPENIWRGAFQPSSSNNMVLATASLYLILFGLIGGSIFRDPQELFASATNIALIPTLTYHYTGVMGAGEEDPMLPFPDIGPLLMNLSHNISISLLSNPRLDTTYMTTTTCNTYHTSTVWKYRPAPLLIAYSLAICSAAISLVIGGHALATSGVVRDRSFSSILRSTRNRDLDVLAAGQEDGALPLPHDVGKQRLRFAGFGSGFSANPPKKRKRMSFQLVQQADTGRTSSLAGYEELESRIHRRTASEATQDAPFLSPRL